MEVFPTVPAASRGIWVIVGIVAVICAAATALLVVTAQGSSRSRFEISDDGLRIRGDLYGQLIRTSAIRGGSAKTVNLLIDTALAPKRRTMGAAVPGYSAGWFRLRNGREALVYLTDPTKSVHVPTTSGYDLLLSPQDPERFVERLRAIAPRR